MKYYECVSKAIYLLVDNRRLITTMKNELLPQKLKELRKAHSYTQDDVAAVLGVVRQTYSHYETGTRTPNAETLYKLANLYNISVDDLFQITMYLDSDMHFDVPQPSEVKNELSKKLDFFNNPMNNKKYSFCSYSEKELLYYFQKLSNEDQHELIEFAKIKSKKYDF